MTANGIRFYDCRVTTRIDGTVVAFAALVRVSRCGVRLHDLEHEGPSDIDAAVHVVSLEQPRLR